MSSAPVTRFERKEALRHISELSGWLNSHKLCPEQAQARADRVAALERWTAYLQRLDKSVRKARRT